MYILAITVLSSYAAKPQMEYLVFISFLPLFSAPIFVLLFGTCALIKQRSELFSPLLKILKLNIRDQKAENWTNQNTLSFLRSV